VAFGRFAKAVTKQVCRMRRWKHYLLTRSGAKECSNLKVVSVYHTS
jgi:hypothetical protein